jgi:hypothetical protein
MTTKLISIAGAVMLCTLLGAAPASAHTDDWFDKNPTPHGGQVRMSGPYHLEVVLEGANLIVYVTDHGDKKIPTANWKAHAVIMTDGKVSRAPLIADGDNRLRANGAIPAHKVLKLVVSVAPPAAQEYTARFTPGSSAAPAAATAAPAQGDHSNH